MAKNLQLRIDNPCSEDWNQMHPEEKGRFCSSCQTTVVDFTTMNEQQILEWFAKFKSNPHEKASACGRFHADQLNRDLIPRPEPKKGPLWMWRYLLAGFLLSSEAHAQTKPAMPRVTQLDSSKNDEVTQGLYAIQRPERPSNQVDTLRGMLTDAHSGQPISAASIMIDRTRGYIPDEGGCFAIPRKALSKTHSLTISSVGYETTTIDLRKACRNDHADIALVRMTVSLMGDVVIVRDRIRPSKTSNLLKDTLAFLRLSKDPLTIFPNPAARGRSISLSARLDKRGAYTVELFSNAGFLVQSLTIDGDQKPKNVTMDLPATLAPGTYFIRLSHPAFNRVWTQQLVVL